MGRRRRKASGNAPGAFHCGQRRGVFAGWSHAGFGQQGPDGPPLECRDAARIDAAGSRQPRTGHGVEHSHFPPTASTCWPEASSTGFWSAAPIVWNDPARAAEKLRLLLQSNADFPSRIRMLSENLRLHEALEKLDTNDVRVPAALAAAQANWHASRQAWPEAVAAFDRLMAAVPPNPRPGCARRGYCVWRRLCSIRTGLDAARLSSGRAPTPGPGRAAGRFRRPGRRQRRRPANSSSLGLPLKGGSPRSPQHRAARAACRARRPMVRCEGPGGRLHGGHRSPFPADTRGRGRRPQAALRPPGQRACRLAAVATGDRRLCRAVPTRQPTWPRYPEPGGGLVRCFTIPG